MRMQAADERAEALRPVFTELRKLSANAIARELNARQIATPSGKPWSAVPCCACSAGWRGVKGAHARRRGRVIHDQRRQPGVGDHRGGYVGICSVWDSCTSWNTDKKRDAQRAQKHVGLRFSGPMQVRMMGKKHGLHGGRRAVDWSNDQRGRPIKETEGCNSEKSANYQGRQRPGGRVDQIEQQEAH